MKRIRYCFLTFLFVLKMSYSYCQTASLSKWLIPQPQKITVQDDFLRFRQGRIICSVVGDPEVYPIISIVQKGMEKHGYFLPVAATVAKDEIPVVRINIDNVEVKQDQGYRLTIDSACVYITAHDKAGLFYGVQTFSQIVEFALLSGKLPALQIVDWPDFERRGVMLDISRDKVPTMETLYQLIDLLACWKINEIQLYTEHTFAYKNHREVWQDSSPMTAQQIIELDKYCRERFIDLVPNQNSFAHMERWLKYDRYLPMAECPTPIRLKTGIYCRGTLSPSATKSLDFINELYCELLPNFSSQYVNIGCDETFELGYGRSKELCEKKGKGRVYLDFLKELHAMASRQGKQVQFWGDIIKQYPKLIPDIPRDMIPLLWGYEAKSPFKTECPKFKESGLDFYVCPGTSTWCSITGRTQNAIGNLLNAAEEGKNNGAKGYLITNWGDYGNWQPLSTYYTGFLYGAAVSWGVKSNKSIDIAYLLDKWVFKDRAGVMGSLVMDLGNVYILTGVEFENQSILFTSLRDIEKSLNEDEYFKQLTKEGVNRADSALVVYIKRFDQASLACSDAQQVNDELLNAAMLCRHSCRVIKDKLSSIDGSLNNISEEERQFLVRDITHIISKHRELWMYRNRIGGLSDSAGKLEKILNYYLSL